MEIVTFQITRFGDWSVKLSFERGEHFFLLVGYNDRTKESFVRTFHSEIDVINFVAMLGERQDYEQRD